MMETTVVHFSGMQVMLMIALCAIAVLVPVWAIRRIARAVPPVYQVPGIAVQIEFVHTGNIGSKCLQFDVQPLVFENKPLLARKELQLAVAGTPPRGLTRAF